MKGQGQRSYVTENLIGYSATRDLNRYRASRKKLCWICQKDKPQFGGRAQVLDGFGGMVHKFICKDCVEAKQRSIAACQDPNPPNP
jgi:hypothetical protein